MSGEPDIPQSQRSQTPPVGSETEMEEKSPLRYFCAVRVVTLAVP